MHAKLGCFKRQASRRCCIFVLHFFGSVSCPLHSSVANMNAAEKEYDGRAEKHANDGPPYVGPEDNDEHVVVGKNALHRDLQGRHMQMIAM